MPDTPSPRDLAFSAPLRAAARPRRARVLVPAALALGALGATMSWRYPVRLVWNATESSPVGLYRVSPGPVGRGETAVAWPPPRARALAGARGYLPRNVPLVKSVAAAGGDRVCALGPTIAINGRVVVRRRSADPSGRAMPWWTGCRRLAEGELFLLTRARPDAFDGRYFGVTPRDLVVGRASLLWAP